MSEYVTRSDLIGHPESGMATSLRPRIVYRFCQTYFSRVRLGTRLFQDSITMITTKCAITGILVVTNDYWSLMYHDESVFLPYDVTHVTSHTRLSAFFCIAAEKAGKPGDETIPRLDHNDHYKCTITGVLVVTDEYWT